MLSTVREKNIFPSEWSIAQGPNIFRLTSSSGATSSTVTLKPREWIICSSVWDSKCPKQAARHGFRTNKAKRMFTDLQRTCLCCISQCSIDCCEELNPLVWTGSSRPLIFLAFSVLWCLCRQMEVEWRLGWVGVGWGGKESFAGACSEMHMFSGLLMVLQRRAQFCLDCLRMDSSGQLASLCSWENCDVGKNKPVFMLFFYKGVRERGKGSKGNWMS